MSVLTLLRHGQASFDADDYDQLSPLGIKQAQASAQFFADRELVFDQILHGPRRRHQQTAAVVSSRLSLSSGLEIESALDEFAEPYQIFGAAEIFSRQAQLAGGRIASQSSAKTVAKQRMRQYESVINLWARGRVVLLGTPSNTEFVTVVSGWMLSVIVNQPSHTRILAVTSAGVIAACVCQILNLRDDQLADVMAVIRNCSRTEIVFSPTRRSLLSFNNTSHLPESSVSLI
ncbi:histidine phosphatase family protein [Sapientia aquatica]|uniref:Histidine phosphatase family protein n=1 Tax=Sapientia aquatica TaxID=1549640 RepID=A0A4R5W0Z3_9BURK|nr:histidine phosphatase family protein [Sapientia aquatica]TDK65653.1 histidine phosphatase family protein [Sapientia aquatica]